MSPTVSLREDILTQGNIFQSTTILQARDSLLIRKNYSRTIFSFHLCSSIYLMTRLEIECLSMDNHKTGRLSYYFALEATICVANAAHMMINEDESLVERRHMPSNLVGQVLELGSSATAY
ncbi:hypothetical protein CEXT_564691 [Caerostris extrusa]|uniref:Uncharacterized protein n=1 Tax=Caerostris extrusa TaxID=172846 RepID=A0AAV4WKX5_CAEEX|nr:hypothetical protein CEXT_564691 [Caerostris extrusa]